MRTPRVRLLAALAALLLLTSPAIPFRALAQKPGDEEPSVKVATYDELGKIILGLKGKVIVVDFWSTT